MSSVSVSSRAMNGAVDLSGNSITAGNVPLATSTSLNPLVSGEEESENKRQRIDAPFAPPAVASSSSSSTQIRSFAVPTTTTTNQSLQVVIPKPTPQQQQQALLAKAAAGFPSSLNPPAEARIYYRAEEGSDSTSKSSFFVVANDNSERSLVWLIALKEIFAKQLPKMPKEYIVRLLFDRSHHSLLCLEQGQVVGGITFKPFFEQRFGEIAFCAVSATHQVKGFGTRLMNHLKEYVKRIGLTHFLTYADNFAIGYFKKQGFSSSISMPKERWTGYIKDYDGGTLMECVINPAVDYFRIPELIRKQRAFLLQRIAEAKRGDPVYPGLSSLLNPKTDRIDDPYAQIPGLKEAGWVKPVLHSTSASSSSGGGGASGQLTAVAAVARALVSGIAGQELQAALRQVVDLVYQHKEAWPFRDPVPPSVVDYLEVIKEPIDLSLIKARVNSGQYPSAGHLRRDLNLMLDNCRTYNRPDTTYYKAANILQKLADDMFGDIPVENKSSSSSSSS